MRRRRRNIEIFSISTLDLFASALGAFILVAVILFPYYLKDEASENRIAIADETNHELHGELETAKAQLATLRNDLASGRRDRGRPFLLVIVRWTTSAADVDLHVIDPSGHEFSWAKPNAGRRDYPTSLAQLGFDMTSGPASELWQDPEAQPGEYKVECVANALPKDVSVTVDGTLYDRSGRHDLPARVLRVAKQRVRVVTIDLAEDGRVALR